MANPGTYDTRFQWLRRSTTKNAQNGQDEETFTGNGYLWGALEQTTGRTSSDYGAEQTGADVEIRVRNYPTLSPLDRLYSAEWDETYILDSIRRANNELVIEAHVYDDLQL